MLSYEAVLYVCTDDAIPISIIISEVADAPAALEVIDTTYPNHALVSLSNLLENTEDLDPEFSKVIDENYWDLI